MNNNATSEKAYRSFKRFRLYTRTAMLFPLFVGVSPSLSNILCYKKYASRLHL